MPISFRKGALAFVIFATASSATSALAETYQILILDEAFFPDISYVTEGDKLEFINQSSSTRAVVGQDQAWQSGNLEADHSYTYVIGAGSPLIFTSSVGETSFDGAISFDMAPLESDPSASN